MKFYRFVGKNPLYKIPYGAIVKVIRFYPKRKVLVEYQGERILTMSYLLRKIKSSNKV